MHTYPGCARNRRAFLRASVIAGGVLSLHRFALASAKAPALKAAVMGATGAGNYGHEHELIFNGREGIRLVAVADANDQGRAKAMQRSGAAKGYADYREMLERERPELVCVAPRWSDQHYAMAKAALQLGAHVYLEKPITQDLAQADELLALARENRKTIAVAHQMRLAPNILALNRLWTMGSLAKSCKCMRRANRINAPEART